jgi:H+/Cl- antiporter ClcA
MEFKKLEIKEDGNWLQRQIRKPHTKKTLLYILLGAAAGFLFYYFSEGMHMDVMPRGEIIQSIFVGAFFGFFITNSPCARGRC